ncbi:aldo/keto reductase [Halalkalicoccus jeotgali B3]|uniref:Aldo/keto reductase n=1 Tax=Halalkalicoccus jeotgali (strain DSM 18796 / CECT 7217 / JCM 14584 / KCTC 4019 / B3) TaxID=795797 RepID=D8JAB4_HALJB|nr:aldo/keto reductase [Halalkalicoccus jeotgali]ADJ14636.1 aldo/keto reductase [Halalkalicoccus jeotgali B3]
MVANESDTFDIGGELTVHRLGFGAMRLTGENIIGRPEDEGEAREVLKHAREIGVDFVDTADSYGPAVSERLIGETLSGDEDVTVATKGGLWRTLDGNWPPCGDPEYLQNALLGSLDRLGAESIDLYQFHRPDPEVPFEDSVHQLAEFKDEGLIEHVGVSNVSVEQLETARDIVEVATVQNEFNVGDRSDEDVLEACEDAGIGFIPWSPIGSGDNDLGGKGEAVAEIAGAHDASDSQIALAWLLQRSPVILPIPGTSSVEHLEENVAASGIDLTDDEMARLE